MNFIRSIISSVVEGVIKRISGAGRIGETFTNREYFQHYGFTSRPLSGAEGIFIVQGNNVIAIASDDRRYRFAIEDGELALYTDEDKDSFGHRIHFKRNREIEIKCKLKDVDVEENKTLDIGQAYTENVGTDKIETITGSKSETIGINKTENITGNKAETILGNKTATVTQNITLTASGNVIISGANVSIVATGTTTMSLTGNATVNALGNVTANVTGTAKVISPDVQLGAAGGPAAARVGDVTSSNGEHPHTHTIAAGSGIVKIG